MKESSFELKDTLTGKTCKMDSQICIFWTYFNITDYINMAQTELLIDVMNYK